MPDEHQTLAANDDGGFGLALLLAALAGWVDAVGLAGSGDLFVSFMSGNTTSLAISLTHHQWPKAASIACIIGLFVGGVAAGDMIEPWGRRHGHSLVLAIETLFLGVGVTLHWPGLGLPVSPLTALYPLVFAMGLQNATMHRAGGVNIGLTYVTGTLVQIGRGIGGLSRRSGDGRKIFEYVALWLSLAAGGGLGVLALSISMFAALCIATAIAAGLAVVTAVTWE